MVGIPVRLGSVPLALSAALGCTVNINNDPTSQSSDPTSGGPGTSGETPTTTDAPTSGGTGTSDPGTSTSSTGSTGSDETGPVLPQWCNGYNPDTADFTVHNNKDESIMDGSTLAAECGGQGSVMIPVFPHFGGFMAVADSVTFDVILDVEGWNLGPNGHFFEALAHGHEINCAQEQDTYYGGYSYSFIPIFPPDGIPDVNVINGAAGHLHLTLHTPDGDVPFDADVVMSAAIDQCGY
ncbi:MAG: hypothetical protein IPJ59_25280 [Nannocystis sp.]|nr:hypothetical protein [Nannocystis sp.]